MEYIMEYFCSILLVRASCRLCPCPKLCDSVSAPLLSNILPHLQTLMSFITHTLPKPLLASLLYRLIILHLASRILPSIGSDAWDNDVGVDGGWDGRPVRGMIAFITRLILIPSTDLAAYSDSSELPTIHLCNSIFPSPMFVELLCYSIQSYWSLIKVLDHSSQVWWRWANIFFTLALWALELLVSSRDDDIGKEWKVE